MVFCGDIALPISGGIKFVGFPDYLKEDKWVGNLEGSLIKRMMASSFLNKSTVFNNGAAINELCNDINFCVFSIANNHLFDAAPIEETINSISKIGVTQIGAGGDIYVAEKERIIGDYVISAFGWEGISCIPARAKRKGVNPYEKAHIINVVSNLLQKYHDKKIICFMHWNYELELYPQPLDRELSHHLIDKGVYAVIGCHAHRVQPIEIYKGHPIVYGLGNFAFMQNVYMNGKLKFPEFSYDEIAFEITEDSEFWVHRFKYEPKKQIVTYIGKETVKTTEFSSFTNDEYRLFFKKNRVQRKFLPVFYYNDSRLTYRTKIEYIKARQKMIKLLIGNKRLFDAIKSVISKIS